MAGVNFISAYYASLACLDQFHQVQLEEEEHLDLFIKEYIGS